MEPRTSRFNASDENDLHFAIMCESSTFATWEARCIQNLLALDGVELKLLILDDNPHDTFSRLRNAPLSKALSMFHRRVLSRPLALRKADLSDELSGVPQIRCKTTRQRNCSEYFLDSDLDAIREHDVDFIMKFGFNIIGGEILQVARYGVWSLHHGDETKYRGEPACFWEIYDGDPITGGMLKKLTGRPDGDIVLKKGFFPTADYSHGANLNRVYLDSAIWPAQVCIDILNDKAEYLDASPLKTTAPIYHAPNNFQMLWFGFKVLKNLSSRVFQIMFQHEEWNVGIVDKPIDAVFEGDHLTQVRWFAKPSRGHFIADPFGIAMNGNVYVLCEDFDHGSHKGVILSIEVSTRLFEEKRAVAIREPFHLSYPYIIEHEGNVYCIPEAAESHEIRLYEATAFPTRWTFVATLVKDFAGADMTVFQHEGRWWMACSNALDGRWDKLHLWHSPSLFGPWQPHPLNPVKIDIRSARPAGTPINCDGALLRPAQDCSRTYGGRITINRVKKLSPTEFDEEPVHVIEPDPESVYHDGFHTISRAGNFTLVDGKRHRFIMGGLIYGARFFLGKLIRKPRN